MSQISNAAVRASWRFPQPKEDDMTVQKLSRREALRGTGVAALAAGVAVLPFAAMAIEGEPHTSELIVFGRQCLEQAHELMRLARLFREAAESTAEAFAATTAPRWCTCGYSGGGRIRPTSLSREGVPLGWEVLGVDAGPRWHAHAMGTEEPEKLETKWFPLKATTREEAGEEARTLSNQLDREFFDVGKRCGVPFDRDGHYKRWSTAHGKMRRAMKKLAKLRATTPEELNLKAIVIAVARGAFDDEFYCDELQDSIMADIARNAKARKAVAA